MDVIVTGKRCVIYEDKFYFSGDTIDDMDDQEALRLLEGGYARLTDEDAVIAQTSSFENMTKADLKKLLQKLEVDYPSNANRSDLIALVESHTAEAPAE
jgi:hypothetical protein